MLQTNELRESRLTFTQMTPPCSRCTGTGAGGRSSRGATDPCTVLELGAGCIQCKSGGQSCSLKATVSPEDRRVIDNNMYFAGAASPASKSFGLCLAFFSLTVP